MAFLIVLGVIGLAGIGATIYALRTDGYRAVPTRDAAFYRSEFDHAEFHAQAMPAEKADSPARGGEVAVADGLFAGDLAAHGLYVGDIGADDLAGAGPMSAGPMGAGPMSADAMGGDAMGAVSTDRRVA